MCNCNQGETHFECSIFLADYIDNPEKLRGGAGELPAYVMVDMHLNQFILQPARCLGGILLTENKVLSRFLLKHMASNALYRATSKCKGK